jgi:hypothetical protein
MRLLLLLIILPGSLMAKTLELKKASRIIYIEERAKWELGKELFGMPFIYFSPSLNGQRSSISFTNTGIEIDIDVKALSSSQNDYQNNKKAWSEQVGAKPLEFSTYQSSTNKFGHKTYSIGFNYEFQGKKYNEKSFYIECRGSLIFAKSLRLYENSIHDIDFKNLLENLDCGGV